MKFVEKVFFPRDLRMYNKKSVKTNVASSLDYKWIE